MTAQRENFDGQPSNVVKDYNDIRTPVFERIYSNEGGQVALQSLDYKGVAIQPGKIEGKVIFANDGKLARDKVVFLFAQAEFTEVKFWHYLTPASSVVVLFHLKNGGYYWEELKESVSAPRQVVFHGSAVREIQFRCNNMSSFFVLGNFELDQVGPPGPS